MKKRKLLKKIIDNPKNIRFDEIVSLIKSFGFKRSRTTGSHHIFVHTMVKELVNLQNVNGMAKPYQIRQFLKLIEKYNLTLGE